MLKKLITLLAVMAAMCSTMARADSEMFVVPANWRLQNYIGGSGLVAWYTGSTCTNGLLSFSSSATSDDRNRFFSAVLSAKLSGKAVGVFYETVSGSCQITSFYMQQ